MMRGHLFVCLAANLLKDPFSKSCGVAFYDDSTFQYFSEQLGVLPQVTSIVVLDISASRSTESKEAIDRRISEANPSLHWHSSAHHYTASTMIFDFDSNGK